MTRNIFLIIILFTLFLGPLSLAAAQSGGSSSSNSLIIFDTTGLPQWAKDLRRGDIVAFGTFPFSMMFVNFFYDLYRWNNANNMDFSSEGRRYAPWPLKSAGAVDKTSAEFKRSVLMAAGLSVTIALTDFIIVKMRRDRQRRMERLPPSGTFVIERRPVKNVEPEEDPPGIDEEAEEEQDVFDAASLESDEPPLE